MILLQEYEKKLDSVRLQDFVGKDSITDELMASLIAQPGLHSVGLKRGAFTDLAHLEGLINNLSSFEKRLQQYFVRYCKRENIENGQHEYLSVKGYYLENKPFFSLRTEEVFMLIYLELLPIKNKEVVTGLYNWGDKLNELRAGDSSDGLPEAYNEGWDELPF